MDYLKSCGKKLNSTLLVGCIMCCSLPLIGQSLGPNWFLQASYEQALVFSITQQGQHLQVSSAQSFDKNDGLRLEPPYLEDADLLLPYSCTLPKGEYAVRLVVSISHSDFGVLASQEVHLFDNQTGHISFMDLTENGLFLHEEYQLLISHELFGSMNCDGPPPSFTLKQQLAPLGLTILGVVGLGVGELLLRPRQKAAYNEYVAIWEREGLGTDAEPWFTEADNVKKQRRVFTYGGGILAVGGAIWYGIIFRNHRRDKKRYEQYCLPQQGLSFQPTLIRSPLGETPGFSLTIPF